MEGPSCCVRGGPFCAPEGVYEAPIRVESARLLETVLRGLGAPSRLRCMLREGCGGLMAWNNVLELEVTIVFLAGIALALLCLVTIHRNLYFLRCRS